MNLRELVILLLGLAMVIVVARGLIVALRARRNQIKLAIDKNIPSDIDLDSLELAELPSGGARVVKRDPPKTEADEQRDSVESQTDAAAHTAVNDAEPALQAQDDRALDEPVAQPAVEPPSQPRSDPLSEVNAQSNNESASAAETTRDLAQADIEDLAAAPSSQQAKESQDELAAQELAGEELFEETDGPLDSSADSPADSSSEPPRFDEDNMEPFSLSAGERIGARDPVPPSKRGGPKKAKSAAQAGDSLLTSARRGLSALMPKKETSSASAIELAPQPPESQVSQGEDNAASDASDVVDPLLNEDSKASMRDDAQALFEGYDQETESDNEAVGQAEAGEESPAAVIETPESPAAESRAVAAADLFPETFDDVVAQSLSKSEDLPKKGKAKSKTPRERSHAAASSTQAPLADGPVESEQSQRGGQNVDSAGAAGELAQPASQELNEVLVINVMAKRGRWLTGDKLLPLLLSQGLKFGELKIFSKRIGDRQDGEVVFSLANSLKPGTFDLNEMDSFATVGVTLFLELPTPINNLNAFDQMLQTAREIVEALDAELRDDQRNMMTGQTIEHYRQRVRDFELRLLHARAAEG
jgi:cell division protein ZipA